MSTIRSLQDLTEHLQWWEPPADIQEVFRVCAKWVRTASFVKLQDHQQVYRCNDEGRDAAVEPVLKKLDLSLNPVNLTFARSRSSADSHRLIRTDAGFGGCLGGTQHFEIRPKRHILSLFSILQARQSREHFWPLDVSYTSIRMSKLQDN